MLEILNVIKLTIEKWDFPAYAPTTKIYNQNITIPAHML